MQKSLLAFLVTVLVAPLGLVSCGGGGSGGDEFIGAAVVSLEVSPTDIDTGDRLRVTANISDVHDNGVLVKFRYPKSLTYVPNSSSIVVDNSDSDVGPGINTDSENEVFLVFFFSQEVFGDRNRGTLTFELEARDTEKNGSIEVDADVDDPLIENSAEFDPGNPEFGAEDSVEFTIED